MRPSTRRFRARPMLVTALCLMARFLATGPALCLEPVTAFDDGFAVPGTSLSGGSVHYPGAEYFGPERFAIAGWSEPFGVTELAVSTVHAGFRTGPAAGSVTFSSSGFDLYGEEHLSLGGSVAVGGWFAAGLRVTRHVLRFRGYGEDDAVAIDAGLVIHPIRGLTVAAARTNLGSVALDDFHEPVAGVTRASVTWDAGTRTLLVASIMDPPRFRPSVSAGAVVRVTDRFTCGVLGGTEPDRFEMLAEVTVQIVRFAYRGSYHRDLGMSHGCSLGWGGEVATEIQP